jgi:hypothetical protein
MVLFHKPPDASCDIDPTAVIPFAVALASCTTNGSPATVRFPVCVLPAFAATLYVTVPLPAPDAVPVTVTQLSALTAVHEHPTGAVIAIVPVPPATANASPPGYRLYVHVCVTTRLNVAVTAAPALSVTCAVKVYGPTVVGVPLSAPARESVSPGGSAPPVTDHVYGGLPPVAVKLCEYATPAVPPGSVVEVVIVGGAVDSTASSTHPLTRFPSPSATWTLKRKVPSVVGVPDSTPAPESVNPAGPSLPDMVHV